MRAFDIAVFFVCFNLAIFITNQLNVFNPQLMMGGTEADLRKELPWWDNSVEDAAISPGGNLLDELYGLATLSLQALSQFISLVRSMVTGVGDMVTRMGFPWQFGLIVNALVWIVYVKALIDIRAGRSEE